MIKTEKRRQILKWLWVIPMFWYFSCNEIRIRQLDTRVDFIYQLQTCARIGDTRDEIRRRLREHGLSFHTPGSHPQEDTVYMPSVPLDNLSLVGYYADLIYDKNDRLVSSRLVISWGAL